MRGNPRRERILFAAIAALLTGTTAGLATLLFQLTRRHGEVLLELESLQAGTDHPVPAIAAPASPREMREHLFAYGAPPGSVAMNFELPAIDGSQYTFSRLKRDRTLLIFISPDCEQSRSLLASLERVPIDLDQPHCRVAFISTGTMSDNEELARRFDLRAPLLIQERDEVCELYFITGTPMAYVFGPTSVSEFGRLEGAQAILGATIAALTNSERLPTNTTLPLPPRNSPEPTPLREGEALPELTVERLSGGAIGRAEFLGQRTLLVMFDPACDPCLDLLPDLGRVHADSKQPEVLMITRRDPALTRDLIDHHGLSFPVGLQHNWEISRLLGALAVPAACVIDPDGLLESDVVIGRQAVFSLLKQTRNGRPQRRLVALTSLLRGR